jgi:hypothetical protein
MSSSHSERTIESKEWPLTFVCPNTCSNKQEGCHAFRNGDLNIIPFDMPSVVLTD